MKYHPIGESGIEASVIALGTWAIGGLGWGRTDEGASIDAIRTAVDQGITLIDTAPVYGLGMSEELVGKAIAGLRDQVVLATKCGHVWHLAKGRHAFDWKGTRVHIYLGPESIQHEVEESLRRLRTDHIDLYQTHWPDPSTPVEDTMAALLPLKDQGKIRAIGVSNVDSELLAVYQRAGPVVSDQEKYNMLHRDCDNDLLPACRQANMAFLAYSPLAQGLLTGKVGPERTFANEDFRNTDPLFSREHREKVAALLARIQPIAADHNITLAQLALAWTLSVPGITHVLAGARNSRQARENAHASAVSLSSDDLSSINEALALCP